ncbi:MAG TPA: hypothetical protein VMU88_09310 [bacterium]|nr:hypothetical protein [bacterium]
MGRWLVFCGFLIWLSGSAVWADATGAKPKTVTLRGTLVDLACYFDDGDSGDDHMGMKGCGKACLNQGSPAGLLVGTQVYVLLFPAANFANYVGKTLEITGDLYGTDELIPSKAAWVAQEGNQPIHWSVKPMM